MTAMNRFFNECDRLDRALNQRSTACEEQAAHINVRAASAVAVACFSVFGLAAVML